jgi:formate hydrogenlyase subunit 4
MSVFIIIITAILFPGIIGRTRSILSGRKGPGLFQPWKNVWVLMNKSEVISHTGSFISHLAPAVILASVTVASTLMPVAGLSPLWSFHGDFLLFAYLLATGRFFIIVNAFGAGSSFQGMGAAREALYGLLIEPAFFLLIASVSLLTGGLSFEECYQTLAWSKSLPLISFSAAFIIFCIALVENSRIPIDDPRTHLELTMIHEVMVLDVSGPNLAYIQIAGYLKFAIWGTFISFFAIPSGIGTGMKLVLFFSLQFVFAVIIGIIESIKARFRMERNTHFIITVSAVTMVIFIIILFS